MPQRIWIDTDAACGRGRTTNPDDCLAILFLARLPGVEIVGISTVFGNAPLATTDRTARELADILDRSGLEGAPVHRGSAQPIGEDGITKAKPAHAALRRALEDGPLNVIALDPLTNLAAALRNRSDLWTNVGRLVAVMGRRPGHLFHPAEGAGGGILFGHGPNFRDFDFDKDPAAVTAVLSFGLPTTLVPYEAARQVTMTGDDLARIGAADPVAGWAAARSQDWLQVWTEGIGRDGFYPFDLVAAADLPAPALSGCAEAAAWVGKDRRLWSRWFYDPDALLVGVERDRPQDVRASGMVMYCPEVDAAFTAR